MGRERVRALMARHTELETRILMEMARPAPDVRSVQALKRQKLAIKDELSRWREERAARV